LSSAAAETSGKHPIFAWNNLLTASDATLTPSSEITDHLAINAIDGKEYTYWQSAGSGVTTLQVDFATAKDINFVAIHGHNVGTLGGTFGLQRWTGAAWVDVVTAALTSSAPRVLTFASVNGTRFRIYFDTSAAVQAAVLSLGTYMQMERGCWTGMTPPWMGRVTSVKSTKSEAGVLLGRSVKLMGVKFNMDFTYLTIPFVRDYWMPFIINAEDLPFFVLWNPVDYPDDAAFCWLEDPSKDAQPPRLMAHAHMSASITVNGRVDGGVI
jgi:hypothetical protein